MAIPAHLTGYPCGDYFDSGFAREGYWDEQAQLQVVVPQADAEELPGGAFLAVGRAGVDGILFGYRPGLAGVWAYYPIDGDYRPIAATVQELVHRYERGELKV